MLDEWMNWVFRSRVRRHLLMRAWRVLLRVQRSTLASAVLVVRRHDGRVLALASTSGELRLPLKELDGWKAVTTQVAEWLDQLVEQRQTPHLMAIEGTPRQGMTFLYSAEAVRCATKGIWVDADVAAPTLNQHDRQLLLLSEGKSSASAWRLPDA